MEKFKHWVAKHFYVFLIVLPVTLTIAMECIPDEWIWGFFGWPATVDSDALRFVAVRYFERSLFA